MDKTSSSSHRVKFSQKLLLGSLFKKSSCRKERLQERKENGEVKLKKLYCCAQQIFTDQIISHDSHDIQGGEDTWDVLDC